MRALMRIIRDMRSDDDVLDLVDIDVPAQPQSTVGRVARHASSAMDGYGDQIARLRFEIAERQEALRQSEAALLSMQAAVLSIAADPALTEDERAVVEAALMNATTIMIEPSVLTAT